MHQPVYRLVSVVCAMRCCVCPRGGVASEVGRRKCKTSSNVCVWHVLGVAVWPEVVEVSGQIASMVGMKVLERRRFLEKLQS